MATNGDRNRERHIKSKMIELIFGLNVVLSKFLHILRLPPYPRDRVKIVVSLNVNSSFKCSTNLHAKCKATPQQFEE